MYTRNSIGLFVLIVILMLAIVPVVLAQDPTPFPNDDSEAVAEDLVNLTVETTESTSETVDGFLDRLITTPKSDLARVLLVMGGVVLLLAGWRVYDFVVVIAGFVIGAAVAVSLLTTTSTMITVGAVLLGGVLGAILSVYLYYVAVFLIGAYIGIVLTGALTVALTDAQAAPLILFVGGLIGGLIMISLSFEFLVFFAALVGAQMLALGMNLGVIWTIIFALIGVVMQLGIIRRYNYSYRRYPSNPLYRFRRALA